MQKILDPKQYRKPATALITKNGYCINYHGKVFFVDRSFNYQPWCKTIQKGIPVPTNEYGRLRKEEGLKEITLYTYQEFSVFKIALKLEENPLFGIDKKVPEKKNTKIQKKLSRKIKLAKFADHPTFKKLSQQLKFA